MGDRIMTGVANCFICEEEFFVSKMKDGKCDLCAMNFPHIKSLEDWGKHRQQKTQKDDGLKSRVMEILSDLGVLSDCECGQKYYKRSPAQKVCGNCPKKETEE